MYLNFLLLQIQSLAISSTITTAEPADKSKTIPAPNIREANSIRFSNPKKRMIMTTIQLRKYVVLYGLQLKKKTIEKK